MKTSMSDANARNNDDSYYYTRSRGESISTMLTESERDMLLQSLDVHQPSSSHHNSKATTSQSIPVPFKSIPLPQHMMQQPPSQASSQGSTGSGFMTSMIDSNLPFSHTPPVVSSYETSHFAKRSRSGSISGRLQSASDYLQDRGLLDQSTKAVLKDLIILGDSELQHALDLYEQQGDPTMLEEMISSGSLQHRLPADLDLLGDLDLDFMNMKAEETDYVTGGTIEPLRGDVEQQEQGNARASQAQPYHVSSSSQHVSNPRKASFAGYHDDGIGDLDFAGDFMGHDSDSIMPMPSQAVSSAAASPLVDSFLSDQERRMRSNSLFSALLDPPKKQTAKQKAAAVPTKHVFDVNPTIKLKGPKGIRITAPRRSSAPENKSMLAESLDLAKPVKPKTTYKKREKKQAELDLDEVHEHIPGSGRPRTWSDPNLNQYVDSAGLLHVDRPDGWVGAYSPDSRKVRIDRFLSKRNHRVWSKTIKYDVRKNFADSRLRVKGRFVRKQDELMMRELMSLT
ncbi:hypothetical protein MPSEU_000145300 [Mayamaea pseudoterrestris]|nr:hypothetical protein MPSEU_000145300 [Mayamaea pseudoterrestris]